MIFEHFAINVEDPRAVRDWYCKNLGLHVVTELDEAPYMIFLGDSSGRVVIELYYRPEFTIIDYKQQHQLTFHFAFVSEDAIADKQRLMQAGASYVEVVNAEDGSIILMLRDPWGLPIQFCQRAQKLNN